MARKSITVVSSSSAATTGGSGAAAQPAKETKSRRSKPAATSRPSSTRAKGVALATNGHEQSSIDVSRDDIARLAYTFWEQHGGDGCSPEEDWFRAESELKAQISSAA